MSIDKGTESTDRREPSRRLPGSPRDLPRDLRRAAASMVELGTELRDFIYFCLQEKINITTITRDTVEMAAKALLTTGMRSANARILAWRRAIDALPDDVKELRGITEVMTNPRGKRILSEPAGTFELLEVDLVDAVVRATRPPTDITDPHKPVALGTAEAAAKRIMIVAATLYRAGVVNKDVRLLSLLDPEMQKKFLEVAHARIDPAEINPNTAENAIRKGR